MLTFLCLDLLAAAALVLLRLLGGAPTLVRGRSMQPTLRNGDWLWTTSLRLRRRPIARGEIVICHYPGRRMKRFPLLPERFVKRVIGLPGETIACGEDGRLTVNGCPLTEPYLPAIYLLRRPFSCALGPDEYFVLGDNRPVSVDSRAVGPLPRRLLTARVCAVLFPKVRRSRLSQSPEPVLKSPESAQTSESEDEVP